MHTRGKERDRNTGLSLPLRGELFSRFCSNEEEVGVDDLLVD